MRRFRYAPTIAVTIALLAIFVATLTPNSPSESTGWQSCFVCGDRGVAHIIINVILFVPFGAALAWAGVSWWGILGLGAALSAGVEYAQLFIPGRDSSLGDVYTNAAGAVVGWGLARWVVITWQRGNRPPWWAGGVAATLALSAIGAAGLLLRPAFPATTYFTMWTPDLGHLEVYHGRVLEASLGSVLLPPEQVQQSKPVRQMLDAGMTVRVRAIAGPPPPELAPLLSIYDDRQQEILLLGVDHRDLVLRYRTHAAGWRLDAPDIRLERTMAQLRPGDTVDIVVRHAGNGICLSLDHSATCGLGFSPGDGWAVLMYPKTAPPWLKELLDVGWVAGLWIPAGLYGASCWGLAIVVPSGNP